MSPAAVAAALALLGLGARAAPPESTAAPAAAATSPATSPSPPSRPPEPTPQSPRPAATGPASLPGATNQTDARRWSDASADELERMIAELARLPLMQARVVAASERFLGVPYQFDPLGEGPGQPPDEDPRLRFDLADCQTYVETVLALARASRPADVLPALDDLRYDGPVGYQRRNHFFEAHWLAANLRKGYVRQVTPTLFGKDAVRHVKAVTARQWKRRTVGEAIKLPDERAPIGRFTLDYLPLDKVLLRAREIPSGTLFAVVRKDRPLTPTMVTHLGIVVQKARGTFVRHAGQDLYAQVVDEEMAHFIERNRGYRKWPVLGLSFLEPLDPAPAAAPELAGPSRQARPDAGQGSGPGASDLPGVAAERVR